MGLGTKKRSTWVTISDGKVTQHVDAKDAFVVDPETKQKRLREGVFARQPTKGKNAGKDVFERRHDYIEGQIVGLDVRGSNFDQVKVEKAQFILRMRDGADTYGVTIPYSSSYSKYLLNALLNIEDFSQVYRLVPWRFTPADAAKAKQGIHLLKAPYEKEDKIEGKFKKEQVPPMKEVVFKGKSQWDDTEQMAFYEHHLKSSALMRASEKEAAANRQAKLANASASEEGDGAGEEEDDAPPEFDEKDERAAIAGEGKSQDFDEPEAPAPAATAKTGKKSKK